MNNTELADEIERRKTYLRYGLQINREDCEQIIAALRQPSSDKVLVPRVPTLAMLEAGRISQSFGDEELDLDDMRFKWNAMLDAALREPR